jgi:glycosyltransferase involved in cell wall biosynthesis
MTTLAYAGQLHNEGFDGWKNNGFPTFALISRRYLARTLTCSNYLRDWLIAHDFPAEKVGVAKLGIDVNRYDLVSPQQRSQAKRDVLRVDPSTFVIAWSARLDSQKRPLLIAPIISKTLQLSQDQCGNTNVRMFIMGDGQHKAGLTQSILSANLSSHIELLGTAPDVRPVLSASDALLLPTSMEGLSIAVAEAMAMGLAIVGSQVGGFPEQLGGEEGQEDAEGGYLVSLDQSEEHQIVAYAQALTQLICDRSKATSTGQRAAAFVRHTFDQNITLTSFSKEIALARPPKLNYDPTSPVSSAHSCNECYLI